MSEEELKNKDRRSRIESNVDSLEKLRTVVRVCGAILKRYKDTEDPVIRYTLFLDKFQIIVDMLIGVISSNVIFKEFEMERADPGITTLQEYSDFKVKEQAIKDEINTIAETLRDELSKLSDYIQRDMYAPDHNAGSKLMKEAKADYEAKVDV
jgi:hypothetical protein